MEFPLPGATPGPDKVLNAVNIHHDMDIIAIRRSTFIGFSGMESVLVELKHRDSLFICEIKIERQREFCAF